MLRALFKQGSFWRITNEKYIKWENQKTWSKTQQNKEKEKKEKIKKYYEKLALLASPECQNQWKFKFWLRGQDLNLQPSGYEPDARTFLRIKLTTQLK